MIPFFDLSRQYEIIRNEVEKKVAEVMRSGEYIEGAAVQELERELRDYIGAKHVITCGNGTDALRISLQAMGMQRGDEVITTAFSFFATAEAIAQTGATPVFADIHAADFNIDVQSIRSHITKRTKAILPVHIFGMPADMTEINRIAKEYGLYVIEDACQAMGASYHGMRTGKLGDAGCFSFYPTKNLGAFGDGGMITTDSDDIAMACRALKSHAAGKNGALTREYIYGEKVEELQVLYEKAQGLYDPCKYYNYLIGGNSRLDSMQAAVLLVKLKRLKGYNARRREIADSYSAGLQNLPLRLPSAAMLTDRESCWHQYAVLCKDKEGLLLHLERNGVGAGSFYPIPLHLQKAFCKNQEEEISLPAAEEICRQTVCLPIYPELTDDEVQYVIDTIKRFFS